MRSQTPISPANSPAAATNTRLLRSSLWANIPPWIGDSRGPPGHHVRGAVVRPVRLRTERPVQALDSANLPSGFVRLPPARRSAKPFPPTTAEERSSSDVERPEWP